MENKEKQKWPISKCGAISFAIIVASGACSLWFIKAIGKTVMHAFQ